MSLDGQIFTRWRVRAGYLVAIAVLLLARPTPLGILFGAAIGLVGLAIRAWAAGYLHKQEHLTTAGPYALTRNPLYLGSGVLAVGAAVATRSIVATVLLLGYFALFYGVVMRREEAELRSRYNSAFDSYALAVPLFFPQLRSSPSIANASGAFSWAQFKKNHEWQAAIGFLLLLAAFALVWRFRLH